MMNVFFPTPAPPRCSSVFAIEGVDREAHRFWLPGSEKTRPRPRRLLARMAARSEIFFAPGSQKAVRLAVDALIAKTLEQALALVSGKRPFIITRPARDARSRPLPFCRCANLVGP